MDYNLAKELKEKGFKQNTTGKFLYPNYWDIKREGEPVYAPNLSELIEATNNLTKVITFIDCGDYKKVAFTSHSITREQTIFEGKTYEECLAKMWLHLMSYKSY